MADFSRRTIGPETPGPRHWNRGERPRGTLAAIEPALVACPALSAVPGLMSVADLASSPNALGRMPAVPRFHVEPAPRSDWAASARALEEQGSGYLRWYPSGRRATSTERNLASNAAGKPGPATRWCDAESLDASVKL